MSSTEKLIAEAKRVLKYLPQGRGAELCEAIELASRDLEANKPDLLNTLSKHD